VLPPPGPLPPDLEASFAGVRGRLGIVAHQARWFAELPSTNDAALAWAERGAPEGALVVADAQTGGRGRQGRTWHSPPGAGIYASIVLRPDPRCAPLLTIAAGSAVAQGIHAATGLAPILKWPNDVYVGSASLARGGRKLAGILAESGSSGGRLSHVVVGCGINVRRTVYPPDIAARATSLEDELGRVVDRGIVLAECLAALAARYDDLRSGRADAVLAAWRGYASPSLQQPVEWTDGGVAARGVAEDVDAQGALLVRTGGRTARVISGDVRWI